MSRGKLTIETVRVFGSKLATSIVSVRPPVPALVRALLRSMPVSRIVMRASEVAGVGTTEGAVQGSSVISGVGVGVAPGSGLTGSGVGCAAGPPSEPAGSWVKTVRPKL